VEHNDAELTPLDELYLQRAYELAARGMGNTAPNPPVGAAIVRDGRIVGEGYHRRAGEAHAEVHALRQAGSAARGATLYISLEPCRHVGRTPPCTQALIAAGIARVVAGARDPTGHGGAAELREGGIEVTIADDRVARDLAEAFVRAATSDRPYVGVKMATSLDGAVASRPGVRERLGSVQEESYVRELRVAYDAVMVGAQTIRIDDPQLTVRPHRDRSRPYVRIVVSQSGALSPRSRVFAPVEGYARTIVLVPGGIVARLAELREVAVVVGVGDDGASTLDLREAMQALHGRKIFSVLCEGGPRLAASLIAAGQADRFYWAIAPLFLSGERTVPVLSGADLGGTRVHFDRIERAGEDVILSGLFESV
jgi:diaminohydroxyphosphoribosylaminopyrimidine deaminase / 5-amino-6-(5-phosphoribosylamino)uracil reductase